MPSAKRKETTDCPRPCGGEGHACGRNATDETEGEQENDQKGRSISLPIRAIHAAALYADRMSVITNRRDDVVVQSFFILVPRHREF